MADPARRQATYADVEAAPAHLVAELIHGSLVTHPRPSPRHGVAAIALGAEIVGPFQRGRGGPGGWVFMTEPELRFGHNLLVPQIAGWREVVPFSLGQPWPFDEPNAPAADLQT